MTQICDLHCDLLLYLINDKSRSAYDRKVRCSISDLREGKVCLQVMAVFTDTGMQSVQRGMDQIVQFQNLPQKYPEAFAFLDLSQDLLMEEGKTKILYAFEGASGFCSEEEPLNQGFDRFESIVTRVGKPLYISLTWNSENRFGGGAFTKVGLKEDGKTLLAFLSGKGIAIDLSHTSDALAEGIFNEIDAKNLHIPVLASHSNYRAVTDVRRNLPNPFAKEMIRRKGVIGFNFVRPFVSNTSLPRFSDHLKHGLELGGEDHICFGADFFCSEDVVSSYSVPDFFEGYDNASCYSNVLRMWQEHLGISQHQVQKISHLNLLNFLKNVSSPDFSQISGKMCRVL